MRIAILVTLIAGSALLIGNGVSAQDGAWTPIYDAPAQDVGPIEMFDEHLGLASTSRAVLRTTDGGASWASVPSEEHHGFAAFGYVDAQRVWAVGESQSIARSDDGGQTWSPQLVDPAIALQSIAVISDTEAWVAGIDVDHSTDIPIGAHPQGRVLHTTDGGRSWINVQPLAGYSIFHTVTFVGDAGWVVASPCVAGQEFRECSRDRRALLRTEDGGATWTVAAESPAEFAPQSIAFVDEMVGYGTTPCVPLSPCERVHRTEDGGETWFELPASPPVSRRLRIATNGVVWTDTSICGQERCIRTLHRSDDGGVSWRPLVLGDGYVGAWDVTATRAVGGDRDDGIAFADLASGIVTAAETPITPSFWYVAFAPDDTARGYATGHGALHASDDAGRHWRRLDTPAAFGRVFPVGNSVIWATVGSPCSGCPALYRSVDNGETWSGLNGRWYLLGEFQTTDAQRAWMTADARLWRTDDAGLTWMQVQDGGRFIDRDFGYDVVRCERTIHRPVCTDFLRTTIDGGVTGESHALPMRTDDVTFVTARRGFAMRFEDEPGPCPCSIALMRTDDGGRNWRDIARVPVALRDFTFADDRRGWAIGLAADSNRSVIYRTSDGGATWVVEFTVPPRIHAQALLLHGDRLTLHAASGTFQFLEDHTYLYERTVSGGVRPIGGPSTGEGRDDETGNAGSRTIGTIAAVTLITGGSVWFVVSRRRVR